jgi:hypothetical protein
MKWKEELVDMFKDRKSEHTFDNYQKAKKEVILPTFIEIEDLLREYSIRASFDKSSEELTVTDCGFIMKTEFDVHNVRFTFKYLNPIEPDKMPPLRQSSEKFIPIKNLTSDIIGELFIEAFEPMKKFYTLINK